MAAPRDGTVVPYVVADLAKKDESYGRRPTKVGPRARERSLLGMRSVKPSIGRRVAVPCFLALALFVEDANSGPPIQVVARLAGPRSCLVEVAAGVVNPCDSPWNVPLYRGKMNPGDVITLQSPSACICWRQTYDNFPEANWSTSRTVCKTGLICRNRVCSPDPDPVVRLNLVSSDPQH